jgi:hypothetical protein
LHDWADQDAVAVLANCRSAIGDQPARLLVADMIMPEHPVPGAAEDEAVFTLDLHMLVMLGARERSASEFSALLRTAGLHIDDVLATSPERNGRCKLHRSWRSVQPGRERPPNHEGADLGHAVSRSAAGVRPVQTSVSRWAGDCGYGCSMSADVDQPAGVPTVPRPLVAVVTLGTALAVIGLTAWLATAPGAERAPTGVVKWFNDPPQPVAAVFAVVNPRFGRYR